MKLFTLLLGLAIAGSVDGKTVATKKEPGLEVTCDLKDGSRLKGTPSVRAMFVRTDYARLEGALANVRKLTIDKNHEAVTLEMHNGEAAKHLTKILQNSYRILTMPCAKWCLMKLKGNRLW